MTKPTKWLCAQRRLRSAWASAQSYQSLRCTHEESLGFSYPLSVQRRPPKLSSCVQRRLWSDWADAQADLSLRWAHSHFVDFVMSRLNSFNTQRHFVDRQYSGPGTIIFIANKKGNKLIKYTHVTIIWNCSDVTAVWNCSDVTAHKGRRR